MADFSQYGGIAEDWEAVFAAQPPSIIPNTPSPEALRQVTNLEREKKAAAYIKTITNVTTEDTFCLSSDGQQIPIRIYRPDTTRCPPTQKLPAYIWYHGGGFLFGTLNTEDAHCYRLTSTLPIIIISICYRHTPESKWPKPLHDAESGLAWVRQHLDSLCIDVSRVLIAGRSAGALLAARVAIMHTNLQKHPPLRGQILDIPLLAHSRGFPHELIAPGKSSYEENRDAPLLPVSRMQLFENLLVVTDPLSVEYTVLRTPGQRLANLPRTVLHVAGRNPLRDHGLLYAKKLGEAGVDVDLFVYPGVPHGFIQFAELEASKKWWVDHVGAVQKIFSLA